MGHQEHKGGGVKDWKNMTAGITHLDQAHKLSKERLVKEIIWLEDVIRDLIDEVYLLRGEVDELETIISDMQE